ncbi:MAG: deoxyribodipyrimidine photo-lyase [Ghiorsea sp.]
MISSLRKHKHSLVCLRRDLRLHDNTALIAAIKQSEQVSLCFVLDRQQLRQHKYHSAPALAFMLQSLLDVHQELGSLGSGLHVLEGEPAIEIDSLVKAQNIDAVFINRDYTPFARTRDTHIHNALTENETPCFWLDDALLNPPEVIRNGSGLPYKVFTAFFNACSKLQVTPPEYINIQESIAPMLAEYHQQQQQKIVLVQQLSKTSICQHAGRSYGLGILESLVDFIDYKIQRDIPALDATTHLSAHLKFGTLSVREIHQYVFQLLGEDHPLIRQLYWRDFFTHVAFHQPEVFDKPFLHKFEGLTWDNNQDKFEAWCTGNTGFLIVDAGMRELQATGYMHNRVRMITASFLVKDLQIDWHWGEAWFARHLEDYDPAVNNGNWQWAASTGCDAQPWFRIFNPWRQQERFDAQGIYIKRWLPHLEDVPKKTLLHWYKSGDAALHPLPIVDHKVAANETKVKYKSCLEEFNVSE